jgi:hypothetical protein
MSCWRVAAVVGLCGMFVATAATGALGASRAADVAIAEAGLLTAADFPAGWTASPPEDDDDEEMETAARRISSCKRYLALRASGRKQPRAESPDFELDQSRVDNSVAVFGSSSAANSAMKLFEHPSVVRCVNTLFDEVLNTRISDDPDTRDVITGVEVDIRPAELGDLGDRSHAYEGTVVLRAVDGSDATAGLGVAAVRVGRAVALYSYFVDDPEVTQLLPVVVDSSLARLDAALA